MKPFIQRLQLGATLLCIQQRNDYSTRCCIAVQLCIQQRSLETNERLARDYEAFKRSSVSVERERELLHQIDSMARDSQASPLIVQANQSGTRNNANLT